jgi:2-aminoadipate transaminase
MDLIDIPQPTSRPSQRNGRPVPARPAFRLAARMAGLKPSAIREILKVTESPAVISFAGGLPAPELIPVSAISRAAQAALARDGEAALQYGPTEGHAPLRAWVCDHVRATAGLQASPQQVLITAGSQQGLDLIAKVLIDPGDVVLVDDPAYLGALQAFRAYEARIAGIPADREGMRADRLREFLRAGGRRPKLLYLVPNFQNPTGVSLSVGRRRELAAVAAEFGIPILEDDPYGCLRYDGESAPAVAALPETADCIYLGTASKILAPGLRVAWLIARDPQLYERLVRAKQAVDLHTSSFSQRLVCSYVTQTGVLDGHIGRLRAAYALRRNAMLAALERALPPECTWTRPDGGLFVWAELPAALDTEELLREAVRRDVTFVPGAPFWVGRSVRNTLRLNFSNAGEARIAEGIGRLAEAIAACLGARP